MEGWKVREERKRGAGGENKGGVRARFICWPCRLDPAEPRGEREGDTGRIWFPGKESETWRGEELQSDSLPVCFSLFLSPSFSPFSSPFHPSTPSFIFSLHSLRLIASAVLVLAPA